MIPTSTELETLREAGQIASSARNWAAETIKPGYLMRDLQEEMGMAILLITHDLGVVAGMAHEVAVMYMGRVVERSDTISLFESPRHPYTAALLRSMPGAGTRKVRLDTISGSVPDPFQQIEGCPFHPRWVLESELIILL